ncbi:glycosyltransferase [Sphingomonas profundi]|uniref:glycosyltransferase n=1 Tax=Alterirhizorhabdus profundi TaxID=2681549 RepID=UPI0018D0C05C|nr:glycosyltransferase [Sphingomonas profundi]
MTGTKRRVHLVTESPAPSGVGAHMLTLAAGLADGNEVVIGAPRGTDLLARAAAAGFAVKVVDPADPADLHRWFARTRPAIVHVHAGIGWEGHATAEAAKAAGASVIRTEHLPYLLTDPGQRAAHAAGLRSVDRLIGVSQAVADSHAGLSPPIVAIANGIVPRQPSRDRADLRGLWGLGDAPVLLMAARFAEQKGHALLLDALPHVRAALPDAIVLLAGDGPLLWPVARSIATRGLAGAVRLLGARGDLPDLMAAADLLLLPSRFEGLSLVALEAMAAGLPIVASDAPGNTELLEHGDSGWLTPASDARQLAATIVDALSDRARLTAVAQAARRRRAERFDAPRMIEQTAALYDEATHDRRDDAVTRTRIGFVGAGGIAHRHFGVLEQFEDVEIVAVADVDHARAAEAAARFGARAFTDVEEMLDAAAPDALYICVPPFAHGPAERAAIARNLPFFVEKPVALDLATAEAIADAVARAGLVTAVGYHWRYLDTVDEVRGILAHTPARLLSGYWLDSTPPPVWWWHEDQSGGQMVEQTTHLLDLARYLVGDVTRAYGLAGHTGRDAFPGLDVPTVSTASLLFENGAIANFASTCLLNWNHRVALHLFGEGLAIELTDRDLMVDVGRGRPVRGADGDPVWREDRDFIDAVRGGENRIRCPYAEAVATHRLALAVVRSARTGEPVTFAAASPEPAYV